MDQAFRDAMTAGYTLDEPSVVLGAAMQGGEVLPEPRVALPLSMANRHGLIAGATGTGKTKTLQLMAGQLSKAGVPVFISDIKGDVTGIAAPAEASAKVQERLTYLRAVDEYTPSGHPAEFLSLSGRLGAPVRATVSSFGPLLLAKVMDLNETQTSVLALVFKYCDDNGMPLLDLDDLATTLKFFGGDDDEAKAVRNEYGVSKASVGVMARSVVMLQQEGAASFFGEPEFDVMDLLRTAPDGAGIVSVLELRDVMDQPRLFSTFMLWMLAQLYETLPEAGDLPKPRLCFFFDEAHLLFADASDALMEQVERTARLIRSKGVGVYFVTQAPTDVPSSVLAQLGNRVQHALRAFTPEDADNLRKAARTFPTTEFYDVERTMTSLGIGEALVTVLTPRGVPSPLAAVHLLPPDSLMAPLPEPAFAAAVAASPMTAKYSEAIDRDSAHEMIQRRLGTARELAVESAARDAVSPTTDEGLNTMTRAQQEREIRRQARELARAEREAEKERKRQAREAAAAERARQRTIETGVRTAGRVITSRAGQSLLRGVFDTIFGGGRRR